MADENSGQTNTPAPQEANTPQEAPATNAETATDTTGLPDDLARLLNGDNTPPTAPVDTIPTEAAPNTGKVHMPPAGTMGGSTIGDNFDMDALFGNSAPTAEKSLMGTVEKEASENKASENKAPAFDINSTAMGSVPLKIKAEIGSTELRIEQLMKIGRGAIIEIDKDIESTLELKVGHHLIGQGHLESDGEYFTVRIIDMIADIDEHHTLFQI